MITFTEFKNKLRQNRGRLSGMDDDIQSIYNNSIPELIELMLSHKLIGIRSMCDLMNLSHKEQYMLYDWMKSKSFQINKHDIDLKVSSIIAESM